MRVDDPHGGRAVAEGTVDVDGSRPVLTGVRARPTCWACVERTRGHRRPAAARSRRRRSTTISFRLSEAGTVTLVDRARPQGPAREGPDVQHARQARAAVHRPGRARGTITPLRAGRARTGSRCGPAGSRPGATGWCSRAADEVGNRSPRRTIGLRVVRLPR